MLKILAFGASSSRHSINKMLASWVAHQFEGEQQLIDLNDYEMPIYSADKEKEHGIPPLAYDFSKHIERANLIVISLAEHNGAYTAAFKNIFDWVSRIPDQSVFLDKALFLLSTSPGARGAQTVLGIAADRMPRNGGKVITCFSLPSFNKNFDPEKGIIDEALLQEFHKKKSEVIAFMENQE